MIYQLTVPGPIEDLHELRVLEWHGGPGSVFVPGELIVELETHKAVVEVRAAQTGILRVVLHQAGEWVAVGAPLAGLSDAVDEPVPDILTEVDLWEVEFQIG